MQLTYQTTTYETTGEFRQPVEGELFWVQGKKPIKDGYPLRCSVDIEPLDYLIINEVNKTYSVTTGYSNWVFKSMKFLEAKVCGRYNGDVKLTGLTEKDLQYMRDNGANTIAGQVVAEN